MWLLLLGCVQLDNDGDGFPLGYDCDDENPSVNGPVWWYADYDEDGFGGYEQVRWCGKPDESFVTWTNTPGDCNDNRADINPGLAERCDGVDEDCDDIVDEEPTDPTVWYLDVDNDGYGTTAESLTQCLTPGSSHATQSGDCDDNSSQISPGREEDCDGIDNNCDGIIDDGCLSYGGAAVVGSWSDRTIGTSILVADDSDGPAQLLVGAVSMPRDDWGLLQIEGPLDGFHLLSEDNGVYQVGEGQRIGDSIVASDLNGDGWEDVMLGVNCSQSGATAGVQIYSGTDWPPAPGGGLFLSGACVADELLYLSAVDDIDEDGGAMIVGYSYTGVGSSTEFTSLWALDDFPAANGFVYSEGERWITAEAAGAFTDPEGGDLDGDGLAEMVLQQGATLSIYDGIVPEDSPVKTFSVDPNISVYGENLLVDDFDGDGRDDIAVQVWVARDDSAGAMQAMVLDDPIRAEASLNAPLYALTVLSDVSDSGRLQMAFASADEQGDGSELLVGAWTLQSDQGAVYMVPSGSMGALTLEESVRIARGEEEDDRLGSTLAVGDMNGDGVPDVLVGAPYTSTSDSNAGTIYLVGTVYLFDGAEIF